MTTIRDFTELDVYAIALRASNWIFHAAQHWPADERFALKAQIIDASRAVVAMIAEAWGRRLESAPSFKSKLSEAAGEGMETRSWLLVAAQCGYITADEYSYWRNQYIKVDAKLTDMRLHPEQWCTEVACRKLRKRPAPPP